MEYVAATVEVVGEEEGGKKRKKNKKIVRKSSRGMREFMAIDENGCLVFSYVALYEGQLSLWSWTHHENGTLSKRFLVFFSY